MPRLHALTAALLLALSVLAEEAALSPLPPLAVTSDGVTYTAKNVEGDAWWVVATKDGKPLWKKRASTNAVNTLSFEQRNSQPPSPPNVQVTTSREVIGWDLETGEILIGFGLGVGTVQPTEERMRPPPVPLRTRFEVSVDGKTVTASCEQEDGLGPWKLACREAADRPPLWEATLPRGHWFSRAETGDRGTYRGEDIPTMTLTGLRAVTIDLGNGDILKQGRTDLGQNP